MIKDEIERLQENLAVIRKAGGWSCEKFGEFLGLSKQSICNLERKTVRMSKAQYIAIRAILDYEMKDNPILYMTVKVFMNSHDIPEEIMMRARTFYNGLSKKEMNCSYIVSGMCTIIGRETYERLVHEPEEPWMDRIMRGEKK